MKPINATSSTSAIISLKSALYLKAIMMSLHHNMYSITFNWQSSPKNIKSKPNYLISWTKNCEHRQRGPLNAFIGKVMDDAYSIETSSLGSKTEREWTTLAAWWLCLPFTKIKRKRVFYVGLTSPLAFGP